MAKKNTKGIIIGVIAACAAIGVLTPDKEAESTELSVPAYQAEYDVDTEVLVEDSTPDEDAAKAEEERLAKEAEEKKQAAREAEEQKAAEEKAAKEAEEQKAAEEKVAKEAEEKKQAEEQAAREAEEQKEAEEKATEEQKLLAAQSEKTALQETSVSAVAAHSEPVQPQETAVVEEPSAPEESTPTPVGEMVWLSATGDKYHSINNCGRMNPNKARQVSLEDAINSGYDRCSKCW